ncbi:MAG: hypothetical protein CVV22_10365 [Ignavibacteriae bacterium HGW-Ignavibacteriae-1]|jgi:hypothetical protein|nr:MAG: hypothetical protein CVV22_10365 [Ignavibacteriae bacterium HGW-Ignavibacteriae-1]
MKMIKCILLTALFVFALQNDSIADDDYMKFGITGGAMSFYHSSDNTNFSWNQGEAGTAGTPDKISQRNYSFPIGLVVEIKPVEFLVQTVLARMTYNDYGFESTFFEHKLIGLDGENETMMGYFSTVDQFDLSAISLELQFKHYLLGNLNLAGGLTFDYFIKNEIKRVYNVHEPDYHTFRPQEGFELENNGRTKVLHDKSEIDEFNKFQFGVNLGISYDFNMSSIQISPYTNFTYYFTSLISDQNLKFNKFNVGIDFMFRI